MICGGATTKIRPPRDASPDAFDAPTWTINLGLAIARQAGTIVAVIAREHGVYVWSTDHDGGTAPTLDAAKTAATTALHVQHALAAAHAEVEPNVGGAFPDDDTEDWPPAPPPELGWYIDTDAGTAERLDGRARVWTDFEGAVHYQIPSLHETGVVGTLGCAIEVTDRRLDDTPFYGNPPPCPGCGTTPCSCDTEPVPPAASGAGGGADHLQRLDADAYGFAPAGSLIGGLTEEGIEDEPTERPYDGLGLTPEDAEALVALALEHGRLADLEALQRRYERARGAALARQDLLEEHAVKDERRAALLELAADLGLPLDAASDPSWPMVLRLASARAEAVACRAQAASTRGDEATADDLRQQADDLWSEAVHDALASGEVA